MTDKKDNGGGYISVDREKALKDNWDLIQKIDRPAHRVCNHQNRTTQHGLQEDYDKCDECGLEIPHNFPYQWNY